MELGFNVGRGHEGWAWDAGKGAGGLHAVGVVGSGSIGWALGRGAVAAGFVKVGPSAALRDVVGAILVGGKRTGSFPVPAFDAGADHALGGFVPGGGFVVAWLAVVGTLDAGVVEGGSIAGKGVGVARDGTGLAVGADKLVLIDICKLVKEPASSKNKHAKKSNTKV